MNEKRVYRYIDLGRLPAYKSGGVFLLAEEDIRQFKLHPPGRVRTDPPRWRVYNTRSKVLTTEIQVPVQSGQQEKLVEKLVAIQQANRHSFPGTIARYIIKGNEALTTVQVFLVWKDTEMPEQSIRERELQALQDELADVLEWDQAQYSTNEALIYT